MFANQARITDAFAVNTARRALEATDAFAQFRQFDLRLNRAILNTNRAVLPSADVFSAYAERTVAALQPTPAAADALDRHVAALADKMAKLTTPWALADHPALSAAGFVRIARLRDVAARRAPYEPPASDVYEEELGEPVPFGPEDTPKDRDAAALESGTNPEVVAFPAPAFPRILVVAGFEFGLATLVVPQSDAGDRSGVFDSQHRELLHYLEHHLRTLVETELRRLEGRYWIRRRVPEDIRKRWAERRQEDRDDRGDSYPPIYYADFMDLSAVISRNDNWNDAFGAAFRHKDDFQVAMRCLHPVRRAIAHGRPLARFDQLCLSSEALRLLRALGVLP